MEDYRLEQTGQEVQRILNGAAMDANLQAEVERATEAEGRLQGNIDAEEQARQDADSLLQQGIDEEAQRAKDAEEANAGEIENIKALIPATATPANKLADTNYVNSSIQTATAEYRGDYNVVTDLHLAIDATHAQIETLLPTVIAEADKNDYCYVMIPTSAQTLTEIAKIERYKMTSEGWKFEYDVNNSTFTAEEWAAIKSGITSGLVAKLNALPTNADLLLLLAGKQDVLTFDSVPVPESNNPVKSGGIYSAIDDEKTARLNSDTAIHAELDGLQAKVPATASSDNKLVDQNQMNSSISTATAIYRGDWNVVSDLHLAVDATRAQIAALLHTVISTADNNDYCYVEIPTSAETPTQIERVERYKFNGTAWAFEYVLNNSGFTAAQWAAINSMITSGLVAKLSALPTNADLLAMFATKQDVLTFDPTPTENSTNPVTSGGVFAADKALSDAIEAILLLIPSAASSLNKLVDTALMNSSISTATATFRGTYNLVSGLHLDIDATEGQIAAALLSAISTADNNDYAFVQIPTSAETPAQIARTDRYKFNGTAWAFEYTLNTSGFTAAQWAAINSTITSALVAKLNALPTASELQEALGILTSGITSINQKIPSTAASDNKLVDASTMESYIAQVIGILDATFNVTSTDGHITLHITQVDGVITSVQVQSTNIASTADLALKASQADLTALASRVSTAEGNITSLTGRIGTAETNIANLQQLYNNLQQSKPAPVTSLPSTGQQQGVIYRLAGTNSYSDYMWNGSSWVLMATYNNAIDDEPTAGSDNLVKSGGVYESVSQLDQKVDKLKDGSISLTWENGYYIKSNGELGNSAAWYCTDYVPVTAGQELYCHLRTDSSGGGVALYNGSKTFLSYVANDSGTEFIVSVEQDGFARFSNRDYYPSDVHDPYVKDLSEINLESIRAEIEQRFSKSEEVLSLSFINGKYVKTNGELGNSGAWYYTDYYPVKAGQKLHCHLYTLSSGGVVALYDESKNFLSYKTGEGEDFAIIVSQDGFVRFSNRDYNTSDVHDPWVENITNRVSYLSEKVELANERIPGKKPFWLRDFDSFVTAQEKEEFVPSTMKICHDYRGQVSPAKRYVAIGFDDFRASDFSMVIPLFDKYGARAVFNRIARETVTKENKVEVSNVLYSGHELGDHTFLHYKFPFDEPLFNGQDPNNPDGSGQSPYPTNAQMRDDRGDGKNAFGIDLTTPVSTTISYQGPGIDTAWGNLSDAECQTIRDYFSVMKDTQSGLGELLDSLSNKYLGTTGVSVGSWDAVQGCYTGGIFTGCKTSENHEIWERILQITELYYKDEFGLNYNIKTWSLPGSKQSGCYFEQNGKRYYDDNHTIFANNLAKMTSSLYRNEDNSFKSRSWTDVLKEFGYFGTHDATYPGRIDGNTRPAMFWQLIINASLSRKDALPYSTNRSVSYSTVGSAYPSSFFHGNKTKAAQMYDDTTVSGVPFKTCIEAIRHNTASGMIHGEVIDSQDNFSMKVFFEEILRFCRESGIEVITKAEAYDVAFNHIVENGNLIYNPLFVNSAEKFLLDAETVPTNPDGYIGNCSVAKIDGVPVLTTTGETKYTHWGIPIGDIEYSAMVKGTGTIGIYVIKNNDRFDLAGLTLLHTITVNSPSAFANYSQEFYIAEAEETAFEQICDGLGEKVCGVQIVYSSGLQVQKIKMFKK